MRLAIPFALFLAATTAPRQGCGNGGTPPAYDACAGKACGESCTVCAPDDRDCVETALVKACDPFHRCVPKVDGLCDAASAACAGKTCGADCTIDPPCRSATPPCMMPSVAGHCDMSGACNPVNPPPPGFCLPEPPRVTSCEGQACGVRCEIPCPAGVTCGPSPDDAVCDGAGHCLSPTYGPPPPPECMQPPPSWGCVGKACGDFCDYCPPGQDPATCPVPTFAATACDAQRPCQTVGTFT